MPPCLSEVQRHAIEVYLNAGTNPYDIAHETGASYSQIMRIRCHLGTWGTH